jgi:hypothetical protein
MTENERERRKKREKDEKSWRVPKKLWQVPHLSNGTLRLSNDKKRKKIIQKYV